MCTVTCGGGNQIATASCHEVEAGLVEDRFVKFFFDTRKLSVEFKKIGIHLFSLCFL